MPSHKRARTPTVQQTQHTHAAARLPLMRETIIVHSSHIILKWENLIQTHRKWMRERKRALIICANANWTETKTKIYILYANGTCNMFYNRCDHEFSLIHISSHTYTHAHDHLCACIDRFPFPFPLWIPHNIEHCGC